MELENTGDLLDKDSFIRISQYLPTGMILRCASVCKNWSEVCSTDDLWIIIFRSELKGEPRLSLKKNIRINEQIIRIWKKEFAEEHGDRSVKDIYIQMRRKVIKSHNIRNPGYMNHMRIFPTSIRIHKALLTPENIEKQKVIHSLIGLMSSDYLY
jgi:hypothetical protein